MSTTPRTQADHQAAANRIAARVAADPRTAEWNQDEGIAEGMKAIGNAIGAMRDEFTRLADQARALPAFAADLKLRADTLGHVLKLIGDQ